MRQNSSENTAKNSSVRGSCVKPSLAKVGGPVQKRDWTHNKTVVQFCGMWRSFVALLLLATPVCAQENATAYEALRVVGAQFGRGALNHVVSITGVKGDPQPEKWKIILENPGGRGVREVEVADGKIDSKHSTDRSVA